MVWTIAIAFVLFSPSIQTQAQAPRVVCAQPVPFDNTLSALPAGFTANDLEAVLACATPPTKGEFETTAEYNARLSQGLQLPKVLAFLYDTKQSHFPEVVKYDADAGAFTISLTRRGGFMGSSVGRDLVSLSKQTVSEEKSMGSNAYGAKVEITSVEYKTLGVALPPSGSKTAYRSEFDVAWSFKIPIPPERARALKDAMRLLVVCEPDLSAGSGLVAENMDAKTATISSPLSYLERQRYLSVRSAQLWVYDSTTGQVLLKGDLKPTTGRHP